jgi:NDP-sugar pyrophosphorylase family protein
MIEIIIYAIIGINLAISLRILASQYRQRKMRKEIERNIQTAYDHLKSMIILRAEQVGDGFYIYNQVTNEFVCQGKNIDEIVKAFNERFPGKQAIIDQGQELIFKEKVNG